jgi:acid phosphatase
VPLFNNVFVVVGENQSYGSVIGSSSMPYLNALANRYGLAINYFANTHPSIGNYFWLTTGQQITNDDNFAGTVGVDNIVRELSAAGKTWKSYAQSLPSVGYTGADQYPYVKRHNPFAYITDVLNSQAQTNNLVPFTQFTTDLANNQLPNYSFIIPNQQNNAHDCPASIPNCTNADKLAAADSWLKTNIDPLIASAAFRQGGLLIITFDESVDADTSNGGGHVATVVISSKTPSNFQSNTLLQHQSTLRLMAEALGLTTFPGAAAGAPNMSEFFGPTPNTAPNVSGATPSSGPVAGGTSVTISGTGFATGATVTFGGTSASAIVAGSTTINAVAPAHTSGTVNIVVTNPDAQSGTLTNGYTFTASGGETVLLADDFNNGAIDGTKWIANNLFSGFTDSTVALQETTAFRVGPLKQNVDGSHYNGIKSAGAFNFTNGYAYVQLVQGPATNTAADAFFTLGLNVDNCYRMYVESGNLIVQSKLGGAKQTLLTVAYNPVNHAFWRIRHDSATGQVVFEAAPANGSAPGTWVQLFAQPWNTSAVPLSSVMFELKGGTWRIEANNPGTVIFDNFKAAHP